MLVTEQYLVPIDFYSIFLYTMEVNILQNIFCVQQLK